MITVRLAGADDLAALCDLDPRAHESERRDFLARAVEEGACFVAEDSAVLGYVVMRRSFFDREFVELLFVRPDARRHGVGTRLMQECENRASTADVFTSTNLSNVPMQRLLARTGWMESGVIFNLDDGDPELVFFKRLRD